MDPRGHIYEEDPRDKEAGPRRVTDEDRARLYGYLHARAEQDETKLLKERVAELEAKLSKSEGL